MAITIEKIQQLVLEGKIRHRIHIYDKLEEINRLKGLRLTTDDVEESILSGEIVEILDSDERGTRYRIHGWTLDDTMLGTICRIKGNLIIITVYEPYY